MNSTCQLDRACLVTESNVWWGTVGLFFGFSHIFGFFSSFWTEGGKWFLWTIVPHKLWLQFLLLSVSSKYTPPSCSWSWWWPGFSVRRRQGRCWFSLSVLQEMWTFSSSAFAMPDIPWPCVNSPMLFCLHRPLFSVWKKELRMSRN